MHSVRMVLTSSRTLLIGLLLCLAAPLHAFAVEAEPAIEYEIWLSGSIEIAPDGTASSHALDQNVALSGASLESVRKSMAQWRFDPSARGAQVGRVPMRLRLTATRNADGTFAVRIADALFGEMPKEEMVSFQGGDTWDKVVQPQYPASLGVRGIGGMVQLVLQVGCDGKPIQVIAAQTKLDRLLSPNRMAFLRERLEASALQAARKWRFSGPSVGGEVDAPYWTIQVPLLFLMEDQPRPEVGKWFAWAPGPQREIPWSWDAAYAHGLRMLTPLNAP